MKGMDRLVIGVAASVVLIASIPVWVAFSAMGVRRAVGDAVSVHMRGGYLRLGEGGGAGTAPLLGEFRGSGGQHRHRRGVRGERDRRVQRRDAGAGGADGCEYLAQ